MQNFILKATNAAGISQYWTGRAGDRWLSPMRDEAFQCLREEADRKAARHNAFTSVHGWTFVVVPLEPLTHLAVKAEARANSKRASYNWHFDTDALFAAAGGVKRYEDLGDGVRYVTNCSEIAAVTNPLLARVRRLLQRHAQFVRFMRETRHAWSEVDRIHFADNSIEVIERSARTGETRQRMLIGPGGDACF